MTVLFLGYLFVGHTIARRFFRPLSDNGLIILALIGLLVIAVYGHHRTNLDLERVCDLVGDHDAPMGVPRTPRQEIDSICLSHEESDSDDD